MIGGQDDTEGNVEVCLDGVWGSVCDSGWGRIDAVVVCEQLGFQGTSAYEYFIKADYESFIIFTRTLAVIPVTLTHVVMHGSSLTNQPTVLPQQLSPI